MNYELPKPDTHCFDTDTGLDVWSYSIDQMLALRNQTLEDAAKVCDSMHYEVDVYGAQCAKAIRNLKGTP